MPTLNKGQKKKFLVELKKIADKEKIAKFGENDVSHFAQHLTQYKPAFVCVQYDPMRFITNFRKFALANTTLINEFKNRDQRGVFGPNE